MGCVFHPFLLDDQHPEQTPELKEIKRSRVDVPKGVPVIEHSDLDVQRVITPDVARRSILLALTFIVCFQRVPREPHPIMHPLGIRIVNNAKF